MVIRGPGVLINRHIKHLGQIPVQVLGSNCLSGGRGIKLVPPNLSAKVRGRAIGWLGHRGFCPNGRVSESGNLQNGRIPSLNKMTLKRQGAKESLGWCPGFKSEVPDLECPRPCENEAFSIIFSHPHAAGDPGAPFFLFKTPSGGFKAGRRWQEGNVDPRIIHPSVVYVLFLWMGVPGVGGDSSLLEWSTPISTSEYTVQGFSNQDLSINYHQTCVWANYSDHTRH